MSGAIVIQSVDRGGPPAGQAPGRFADGSVIGVLPADVPLDRKVQDVLGERVDQDIAARHDQLCHALSTEVAAPSARICAATWSAAGSHTVSGSVAASVVVSVPFFAASEPADDHDQAVGTSVPTVTSPRAAPIESARLKGVRRCDSRLT